MSYQKKDGDFSIQNFEKFGVPVLKKIFGVDAQIFITESRTTDDAPSLEKALDFAGIDGVIVGYDGLTYFYASRVQRGKCYESFSLRGYRPSGAITEFVKLQHASKINAPMPTYHIQIFVADDEQSATVGFARTIDLLRYCERQNPETKTTATGERFFVIPWTELEKVKIFSVDACGLVEEINIRRRVA